MFQSSVAQQTFIVRLVEIYCFGVEWVIFCLADGLGAALARVSYTEEPVFCAVSSHRGDFQLGRSSRQALRSHAFGLDEDGKASQASLYHIMLHCLSRALYITVLYGIATSDGGATKRQVRRTAG